MLDGGTQAAHCNGHTVAVAEDGHCDALAVRPDPLHRTVRIVIALPVDEERIAAGRNELVEKEVRIRDHPMDFEGQVRHPPKRLDDPGAHRKIRHEVAVHDVHVDPIGAGFGRVGYLLAQPGEVGGQDRGGKLHGVHVLEASKMLSIDASSMVLYSASDCCTDRPSTSAREKLATTP